MHFASFTSGFPVRSRGQTVNLYINQPQKKNDFRNAIYSGDIFLNTDLNAPKDLRAFARESITATFDGEILTFSGSHLHGTVPNDTEQTRFSIDFRLVHIADLLSRRGAVNVDSGVADAEAGYKNFFHVSDFSHFQGTNQ
jgi:hypothetical protein